jgi:hypothetical protein
MDQTTSPRDGNTLKRKTMRRRVVLRERDYFKLHREAMDCGYHRTDWQPVTYQALHQEMTWAVLCGAEMKDTVFFSTRELRYQNSLTDWQRSLMKVIDDEEKFMRQYIHWLQFSRCLYNDRWQHWSWKFDDHSIKIRYRQNQDYEPLGIATLERDY